MNPWRCLGEPVALPRTLPRIDVSSESMRKKHACSLAFVPLKMIRFGCSNSKEKISHYFKVFDVKDLS